MKTKSHVCCCLMLLLTLASSVHAQKTRERWSTIPGDALVIASVDLTAIRNSPELALLPWEVVSVISTEQLGVDFTKATSVELAMGVPMPIPEFGAAIFSNQPVDIANLIIPDLGDVEQSPKKADLRFRQLENQQLPMRVAQTDAATVFFGTSVILNRMITGSSITSKALDVAKESKEPLVIVIALEKVRPVILGFLNSDAGSQLPADLLEPLKSLVEETKVVRLTTTLGTMSVLKLDVYGNSSESMKSIEKSLGQLREMGIAMLDQELAAAVEQDQKLSPAMKQAFDSYAKRLKEAFRGSLWTSQEDRLHVEFQASSSASTIGLLVGILLPAVQSARDAARRMSSSNNLKQCVLAMLNYESAYRKLPPRAILAKDGTPLLSWRVAILPFIEQANLYDQFHLDEPWDSDHNIKLLEKMPQIFASPQAQNKAWHSNYVMPYGEGLPGSQKALRFVNITDGTSNTIALVEVDAEYAVPWSAPEDIDADETLLTEAFPSNKEQSPVVFYDGSARFLSKFINEDVLHALLTHQGGEVIDYKAIEP